MINFEYTLGFMDYAGFVVMVVIYLILMIYLNARVNSVVNKSQLERNSQWNVHEKNETFFSVALSNIAKYSSWMLLLGIFSDVFENGIQFYIFFCVGSTFMTIFMYFVVIPVFHESEASTLSEYLEQRFDDVKITLFSSLTSIICHICLISLSIYAVALILWAVMNVNFFILTSIIHTIHILMFITFDRRIKTSTWTNVISILMTCGLIVLIQIKGTINFGGFMAVLKINWSYGNVRVPNLTFDPKVRETLWSLMTGGIFWFTALNLQRKTLKNWLKLKEKAEMRKGIYTYLFGIIIVTILCIYTGMLMYATFHNANIINRKQLLAHLFVENFNQLPAATGIFISIIFLSTFNYVSCELNTIRRIVNENIEKCFRIEMKTKDVTVMRLTAIIVGILSIFLTPFMLYSASSLLEITISIPFTFVGCTFGILIIGIMIPWIGRRATFYGAIISFFMMIYYVLMAEIDFHERKFTSNSTNVHVQLPSIELNYTSSYYYLPSSVLLTCINAFILSFIFGFDKSIGINPKNFAPFMKSFITHHHIIEHSNSNLNLILDDENIEDDTN